MGKDTVRRQEGEEPDRRLGRQKISKRNTRFRISGAPVRHGTPHVVIIRCVDIAVGIEVLFMASEAMTINEDNIALSKAKAKKWSKFEQDCQYFIVSNDLKSVNELGAFIAELENSVDKSERLLPQYLIYDCPVYETFGKLTPFEKFPENHIFRVLMEKAEINAPYVRIDSFDIYKGKSRSQYE